MNDGLIPKRYAKALYKYAAETGNESRLYDLMRNIADSFASEPQLSKIMSNPFVKDEQKAKLLIAAAGNPKEHPILDRMVALLVTNKRIGLVGAITLAYLDIFRAEKNIHRVKVVSAAPLSANTEKRIKEVISKRLGGGTMEYQTEVNPDLIGGFTVNIDNNKLDASVSNELKQMKLKLLSN